MKRLLGGLALAVLTGSGNHNSLPIALSGQMAGCYAEKKGRLRRLRSSARMGSILDRCGSETVGAIQPILAIVLFGSGEVFLPAAIDEL